MNRVKTVWACADCHTKREVGHRDYRDMECCGKVAEKTFVPISEEAFQELRALGCYDKEAEIDYQRHLRRTSRMSRREVM